MSEQSAKPYLVRAICEWCADNGLTPYLAVQGEAQTRVPAAFVKNGEIVLNVSATATRKLTIDNQWIQFTARFNGSSQEVAVPIGAVIGIFAKETGYGFSFTAPDDPVAALASSTAPREGDMSPRIGETAAQASVASAGRQVALCARTARRSDCQARAGSEDRGERALQFPHAGIAQLVEQRFCKPLVVGSIPTAGTSLCHRIPATAATATSKTSRGTGGAGAIATSPEHLCAAGRCHRTLPSTPRPATRHRSRAYECRICEASRSDARQSVLSGNNPGIQRDASAAGKARRSGARVLSDVSTPCSRSPETTRRA